MTLMAMTDDRRCPGCDAPAIREHLAAKDAEIARLRDALQRLADCDWVITLPDRMDAVRAIARAALGPAEGGVMSERNPLNDFADRWEVDGDLIRCRSCVRAQQTSWALHDFHHASYCRAEGTERQPWVALQLLIGSALSKAREPQPIASTQRGGTAEGGDG